MAKPKKKPTPKKVSKPKAKARKSVREDSRGMGDNISAIRKAAEPWFEKAFALEERRASDAAGYASDFADLYEKGSNEIGCKPAVLKREFRRALSIKKEKEAEADMDSAERDQTDAIRAAMEGTQFEMFFMGDLAPPSKDAIAAEKAAKEAAAKAKEKEKAEAKKTDDKVVDINTAKKTTEEAPQASA